ncbi:immunity protein YezG family protein [Pseudalkalibacillus sp. Hm43]|uniref:immunity protein YezG family protein n=1 Tax=Pseudalkalibacillus sp. Hm43 TaxID=3450742 RepID=UPI003F42F0C6
MQTKEMEQIYQLIVDNILEIIPEDWQHILLHGQIDEDHGQIFFYYMPEDREEYIYSLDIKDKFNIDESFFELKSYEIYESFNKLQDEFKNNAQELWTHVTFVLKNDGTFKIDYEYRNNSRGPYENKVIFDYLNFKIIPQGNWESEIIASYLEEQKD